MTSLGARESAPGEVGIPPAPRPTVGRRRRHTARWLALVLVLVLVAVAVVLATRPSAQAVKVPSPLLGRPAPEISGTTLSGGHFSLSEDRGRYVYVNFFASWCPPCNQEEPDLIAFNFQQQQHVDGARLVSVVYDDPNTSARQFVTQWGAGWPTVTDPGGRAANDYGVSAPPTTVLVDPSGRVVAVYTGPVTTQQLERTLSEARERA